MKKESETKSETSTIEGVVRQSTDNPVAQPKLTLEQFESAILELTEKYNYTMIQAQRFFERVHGIKKDEFEELKAQLD